MKMSLAIREKTCFATRLKRERILMRSIKLCWQITRFGDGLSILYIRVLDAGNNSSLAVATVSALTSTAPSRVSAAAAALNVAPEVMTSSMINIRLPLTERTVRK